MTDPSAQQTDRQMNGQTELRWLRHAKTLAAFVRKNNAGINIQYKLQCTAAVSIILPVL